MSALPEDILLEIQKYCPKLMSATCKFLRKKFDPYNNWISDRKVIKKKEGGFINFIMEMFVEKMPEIDPDLKVEKIRKLKLTTGTKLLKKCKNLEKILISDENLYIFTILKNMTKLDTVIIDYKLDWYNTTMLLLILDHFKDVKIHLQSLTIHEYRDLLFACKTNVQISILRIGPHMHITQILDTFMEKMNCKILVVPGGAVLTATDYLQNYNNNKQGKKIWLRVHADNIWLINVLSVLTNDWIKIILD